MPEQLHEDLGVGLKAVIVRSIDEAATRGAAKVEAEHLLLSIAASGDVAAGALADAGLDYAGVEAALRGERERALRAAGVEPVAEERLHATGNSRPGCLVALASVPIGLCFCTPAQHNPRGTL